MSKVSNLDAALKQQLEALDGVQKEMVKSDMQTWKWNKDRIRDIESFLDAGIYAGEEIDLKTRRTLLDERHKLITECTSLYSHINRALKGTFTTEDELDNFLSRK